MSTENVTRFYHKKKSNAQLENDFAKLKGRAKSIKDGSRVKFLENGAVAILRLGDEASDGTLEIHSPKLNDKYRVKVKYTK